MYRFGFLRFFLLLLLVGAIVAGGIALYNAGWSNGYAAGVLSAGPAGTDTGPAARLPYAYYPVYGPWGGGFGFFPFGWLFGLGFFLFFFFVIGSLFRLFGWRRWAHGQGHGPAAPPWAAPQPKEQSPAPGEEKKQE